ncbi:hypothetical protein [Synechococcus sp. RedBA-s]|uniref:hypothetical protein n=1 Tax=Synechococcus sp. RedBA-s TaxID=2823741 RepID=UPI0020CD9863|nr:hypothetical protein [Synechococcus sp. RedBA-s]MCP9801575.1 hypothetical protein [Synechococcus sp. RedBA-s]
MIFFSSQINSSHTLIWPVFQSRGYDRGFFDAQPGRSVIWLPWLDSLKSFAGERL